MLLVNMFIVILLRSYIDVKRQDFNDPIAAEIRKKGNHDCNDLYASSFRHSTFLMPLHWPLILDQHDF